MPRTTLRGLSFYYECQGDGPRLLYLNGSGGDLRKKPSLFDGPLPQSFTVLAHDQRGLGQTEKPDVAYAMADYAADAVALLDDQGWERCHVMGVSFGGMVAQELAVTFPARVEKLVLCCTSPGGADRASYPLHTLAELAPSERAVRALEIADTRFDAAWREANPEAFARLAALLDPSQAPGAGEPGQEVGARRQMEARAGHDVWDRLPALRCPTLVCAGRSDGIAPLANSQAIASRITGAKLEVFDGGHLFLMQDPRALRAIVSFLAGDQDPRRAS